MRPNDVIFQRNYLKSNCQDDSEQSNNRHDKGKVQAEF